jgi:hypothetical protein
MNLPITPEAALTIVQLALAIKTEIQAAFAKDNPDAPPLTDDMVIAKLQADADRVIQKIDDARRIPPAL